MKLALGLEVYVMMTGLLSLELPAFLLLMDTLPTELLLRFCWLATAETSVGRSINFSKLCLLNFNPV